MLPVLVIRVVFWAAIVGLLAAAFAAGSAWFLYAALGVGFLGALNGVFGD